MTDLPSNPGQNLDLPVDCVERCPVLNDVNVDEYPVCFTRNCEGPGSAAGYIVDKVRITKDGTATKIGGGVVQIQDATGETRTITFVEDVANGEPTCRNRGLKISIDHLLTTNP